MNNDLGASQQVATGEGGREDTLNAEPEVEGGIALIRATGPPKASLQEIFSIRQPTKKELRRWLGGGVRP